MKQFDFAVVGNSVAAMVAARELARGGNSVALCNPAPQWGAHFGGLEYGGQKFDIGMSLLEFTSFADQDARVEPYSAETRNDAARFTDVIRNYIGSLIEFTSCTTPQSLLHGVFASDFVIANRFDLLDSLGPELRQRMIEELSACMADLERAPAMHARNKLRQVEFFAAADYATVSRANHGATLHDLIIEPACRRILDMSAGEISALLHRVAWMPLYYPETLLQPLQGAQPRLPVTEFSYPRAGNFAAVVGALKQDIQQTQGLELMQGKIDRLARRGSGWAVGEECEAAHLAWAQRPGQLLALVGGADDFMAYRKASVYIAFATIASTDFTQRFSTLFVLDADSPIYRITDQTWSAGQQSLLSAACSIEISSTMAATWPLDDLPGLAREIGGQLTRLGVLRGGAKLTLLAVRNFKDAIISPTSANRAMALAGYRKLTEEYSDIALIGAAAPFGASSFNDHVAQGLRLCRLAAKRNS